MPGTQSVEPVSQFPGMGNFATGDWRGIPEFLRTENPRWDLNAKPKSAQQGQLGPIPTIGTVNLERCKLRPFAMLTKVRTSRWSRELIL